jgi:hypothetical protein
MFASYLKDAYAEEITIGDTAIFFENHSLQYEELNSINSSVVFKLNPDEDEDSEFDEVSGEVLIEGESVGRWSISYNFFDDYLHPGILEEVASKDKALATKVSCHNIKSLLVLEWYLSREVVDTVEGTLDYLMEKYKGILFINRIGIFDRSGFLVGITQDLYEY